MRGIQITVGSLLAVLFLATAVYLWSADVWNYVPKTSPADYGMIGQMILSLDKVDLVDGSQAGLPWAGDTWLIWLSVNPQDAESIIAKLGYLEDTIPKEELAADGKQAQYDVKIRVQPITQQCIYGPDMSSMVNYAPLMAKYEEFDAGTGIGYCPHKDDWWQVFVEPRLNELRSQYGDASAVCARVTDGGFPVCHAYVFCLFGVSAYDPGRVGYANLSLKSLYTKDKVTISAGYKSASTEISNEEYVGTADVSKVLYYGSEPIGKIDFSGYLQAPNFCPSPNYIVFSNGSGWRLIPETMWSRFYSMWSSLESGTLSIDPCLGAGSSSLISQCRDYLKSQADIINNYINSFNGLQPEIDGKEAVQPEPVEYSSSYFFAIEPDKPVAYSTYRIYLKASWVGILVSAAKPQIQSVYPQSVSITGPETQSVSVTVANVGDVGGISVKVYCNNNFLVDGKSESSRSETFNKGDVKSFSFTVSYGGSANQDAAGTCNVEAISTADPNIKDTATFTVRFTPKGIYPPNTTVCISRTAYARTDDHGMIIPGTERTCPENTYCEDTDNGAQCVEEAQVQPPTITDTTSTQGTSINWILAGIIAAAVVITLLIALVV